ncbi:MAG TPA: MlaD family protein [Solirubrobacteraceae bacterium]|nr:MlaD family protein [Solirubrobacteraceae bacterium]
MAITRPPTPPSVPEPPGPPPGPPAPPRRTHTPSTLGRALPVAALALVVLIIAYLIFSGPGSTTYQLILPNAYQLVRGNTVQVGGVPVGSVTNIVLDKNYQAKVTIQVKSSLAPLHHGTVAEVRTPSLSSVANRYVALSPGPQSAPAYPGGGTLPATVSKTVTDLDEVFNTFNPRTLKGLQGFLQGTAEQYAGAGRQLGQDTELFAPAFQANSHVFEQLIADQPVFEHFLVESAKALTTIGARAPQLTDLVENANTTFKAIGDQQEELKEGLKTLPETLHEGNEAFKGLPPTLAALEELTNVSRPTTKSLTLLLERLRPLVLTATPVVKNLALSFSRPGKNNDLTELAAAVPALAKALTTSSPSTVQSLKESVPITAFWGPYSPDLAGTVRSFGQSAAFYDADGHYAHVTPVFASFKLGENNNLTPAGDTEALSSLKSGQLRRCPGGATEPAGDKSSPFVDGELLSCDAAEVP